MLYPPTVYALLYSLVFLQANHPTNSLVLNILSTDGIPT